MAEGWVGMVHCENLAGLKRLQQLPVFLPPPPRNFIAMLQTQCSQCMAFVAQTPLFEQQYSVMLF
jgi:hypothetical protein